jgi:ADP-heptose:LPS heptosyltransferase
LDIRLLKKIDQVFGKVSSLYLPSPLKLQFERAVLDSFLFIRPGGIGDAVHLIPAILSLKNAFPHATIDILAERRNAAVFRLCPEVDQVLLYDCPRDFLSIFRRKYDVIIDTEQWHRLSAVVARLIRSDCKIGFATNERGRMFTHGVGYSQDDYEVESFSHLLTPLGVAFDLSQPFLQVPLPDRKRAEKLLAPVTVPFVTLFPGASIPERRWGAKKFGELANRLRGIGMEVVVIGGGEDRAQGEKIVAGGGLNLAGQTSLTETAAVLQRSALLVSGDSGVLHLAVGLDVPTVSLFGPGIAEKWAPRGDIHRVIDHHLACSPCTRFGTTPPCPIQARCLADIGVDEVLGKIRTLIG